MSLDKNTRNAGPWEALNNISFQKGFLARQAQSRAQGLENLHAHALTPAA